LRSAIAIGNEEEVSDAARTTATTTSTSSEKRGPVLEVLRELLAEGRDGAVLALVSKLVARNGELEQRLAQLLSRGHKNEGISAGQLKLFLDALGATVEGGDAVAPEISEANDKLRSASGIDAKAADEATTEKPARQPPLRQPAPSHLPRIDNPITVPPAERPCPSCGAERVCIGHDVTEVIELVPAQVVVRVDQREKLACETCEGELVRAPAGDKVVSGGRLGSTLVAALLVDKYDDGLPLHRQKRRFERLGLPLSVSTLADQVTWGTDLLRPLWRAAVEQVLAARVMHLDATGLPVLDRDAAGGKRLGSLWGYVGDENVAAYLYTSTGKKTAQRPGEVGPEDMLARRTGYTVADASNLFDASFERPALIECGCNMHGRRYFAKALDGGDARAALPIAAYKKLYEIEAKIRDQEPDEKLATRRAESKPVWDELVAWCDTYKPHEPPSSPLGAAIRYLMNHKDALGRFLADGVIPIDNGIVERLHVRAALTRKNYLFAGSDTGGERAAIAYTILGCCRLAGVNPVEYLADVLPRLGRRVRLRDVADLLPAPWQAAREAAKSAQATDAPIN
jgi:transposase